MARCGFQVELRGAYRRDHANAHPGGAGARAHGIEVGLEFGGVQVAVGVDPAGHGECFQSFSSVAEFSITSLSD